VGTEARDGPADLGGQSRRPVRDRQHWSEPELVETLAPGYREVTKAYSRGRAPRKDGTVNASAAPAGSAPAGPAGNERGL